MLTIINLKKASLITAMPFFIAVSCNKSDTKPCYNYTPYSFSVTSEWSPQREAYSIGDTIFLTSSFPKTLLDNISNQNIDYSNSTGIGGNIIFGRMDTVSHSGYDASSHFEVIPIIGNITPISANPEKGINSNYSESASYTFKMGIKLKQKGLYVMGVTDMACKGLTGKNCTNAGFNMTVTNSNKNINLFQYALGYTPDALLLKSIYCFRVQ